MPQCSTANDGTPPQLPAVKLRLIWKACSPQQDRPKQCFNDTMSEKSFSAWKLRVESKFQSGPVSLRYCPCPSGQEGPEVSLPLESEQDFVQLRLQYKEALSAHSKPTTYRVLVFASSAAAVDCTTLPVCPTRQERRLSGSEHSTCTVDLVRPENVGVARSPAPTRPPGASESSVAEADDRENDCSVCPPDPQQRSAVSTRPSLSPGALPLHKKQKLRVRGQADSESCATPLPLKRHGSEASAGSVPQPSEVCWEHVLKTLVKTIDRHHFGSKLAGARVDL